MKKRLLSALFAAFILFSSCTSGNEDKETQKNDVPATTDSAETTAAPETTLAPDLTPAVDYKGYEFTVLTSYPESEAERSLFADERNGAAMNEVIAKRNLAVEQTLNITIKEKLSNDPAGELGTEELSSSSGPDAVSVSSEHAASLISSGLLLDLYKIEGLDVTAPYFDSCSVRDLSLGRKLYAISGDLINSSVGAVSVVLCNTELMNSIDFVSEFGAPPEKLVSEGKWTLDVMTSASLLAESKDKNEDGGALYRGFSGKASDAYSLSVGSLGTIFEKDESDLPQLNVTEKSFTDILKKVVALFGGNAADAQLGICTDSETKEGETLFTVATLEEAAALAKKGYCFTVLPMPKYDNTQLTYACGVQLERTSLAGIPVCTADSNRSAVVLCSLFEGAREITKAEYLTRFTMPCSHAGFAELPLILASKKYDLGYLFGWGEFDSLIGEAITFDDPEQTFAEMAGTRALAAEKATDIILKRLLGEDYKNEK